MRSLIPIQAISDLRLPIQAFARQKLKYLQVKKMSTFFYKEIDNNIPGLPTHPVVQKERQAHKKGKLLGSCIINTILWVQPLLKMMICGFPCNVQCAVCQESSETK
jgi:hypothetical protein